MEDLLPIEQFATDNSTPGVKKKVVRIVRERTEALSGYAFFVKEEKQKVGPSTSLNMKLLNLTWSNMSVCQKEVYFQMSREDKLSLGQNYRKNRKRVKSSEKIEVENEIVTPDNEQVKEDMRDMGHTEINIENVQPSLCSLLELVNNLDSQISERFTVKAHRSVDLCKLKVEADFKAKELSDLDTSIVYYSNKCRVLRKKKCQ